MAVALPHEIDKSRSACIGPAFLFGSLLYQRHGMIIQGKCEAEVSGGESGWYVVFRLLTR